VYASERLHLASPAINGRARPTRSVAAGRTSLTWFDSNPRATPPVARTQGHRFRRRTICAGALLAKLRRGAFPRRASSGWSSGYLVERAMSVGRRAQHQSRRAAVYDPRLGRVRLHVPARPLRRPHLARLPRGDGAALVSAFDLESGGDRRLSARQRLHPADRRVPTRGRPAAQRHLPRAPAVRRDHAPARRSTGEEEPRRVELASRRRLGPRPSALALAPADPVVVLVRPRGRPARPHALADSSMVYDAAASPARNPARRAVRRGISLMIPCGSSGSSRTSRALRRGARARRCRRHRP